MRKENNDTILTKKEFLSMPVDALLSASYHAEGTEDGLFMQWLVEGLEGSSEPELVEMTAPWRQELLDAYAAEHYPEEVEEWPREEDFEGGLEWEKAQEYAEALAEARGDFYCAHESECDQAILRAGITKEAREIAVEDAESELDW